MSMKKCQFRECLILPWQSISTYSSCGPFRLHGAAAAAYSQLIDFDSTFLLRNIRAKTLVYNGEWDEAQDFAGQPFVELIEGTKKVTFKNTSHIPHLEDNGETYYVVAKFLVK